MHTPNMHQAKPFLKFKIENRKLEIKGLRLNLKNAELKERIIKEQKINHHNRRGRPVVARSSGTCYVLI